MMDEQATAARPQRRSKVGRVVSNSMAKTIVVVTEQRTAHPAYGKIGRHSKKFKAHDERGEAQVGDLVRIMETRPMSAEKRWRLVSVLEKTK